MIGFLPVLKRWAEFPYWPNTVMARHVQPAADRAGIGKRIGWHTFRHTFCHFAAGLGGGNVTQELLRHSFASNAPWNVCPGRHRG